MQTVFAGWTKFEWSESLSLYPKWDRRHKRRPKVEFKQELVIQIHVRDRDWVYNLNE